MEHGLYQKVEINGMQRLRNRRDEKGTKKKYRTKIISKTK